MAVADAEADLERLHRDITTLRARLVEAEAQVTKIKHYIELARIYEKGESGVSPHPTNRSGVAARIANTAREVLQEIGEPMQTRVLVDEMGKRGFKLGGSNPVNYLSGVLSRSGLFDSDRVSGWHLSAWNTAMNRDSSERPHPGDGPEPDYVDADDDPPAGL